MADAPETNGRTKINLSVALQAAALLVTVIIALGGLAMYAVTSPIRAETESLDKAIGIERNNRSEAIAREREIADLKIKLVTEVQNAKLIEIETQFRAADQARNVQFATQQRTDAIIWEKLFGGRYPSDALYYPNISR